MTCCYSTNQERAQSRIKPYVCKLPDKDPPPPKLSCVPVPDDPCDGCCWAIC